MNPNRVVIRPVAMSDIYAERLAEEMGVDRVVSNNYTPRQGDVVVNFGTSYMPNWNVNVPQWINKMFAVGNTVDKIKAFKCFKVEGVRTPSWTLDLRIARDYQLDGHTIFARTKVNKCDGEGLIVCKPENKLPDAPLYTVLLPNCTEFRFNVVGDFVIDVYERKPKFVKHDPLIKTTDGGWWFTRHPAWIPKDASDLAIRATKALGLDFCGVDVVYSHDTGKSYVLEGNTAPLIYKETPGLMAKALWKMIKEL